MFTNFCVFSLVLVAVLAEPPRTNSRFSNHFQQVEEVPVQPVQNVPVPGQFLLFQRLQIVPQTVAAVPQENVDVQEKKVENQPETSTRSTNRNDTELEADQRNSTERAQENEKLTEARGKKKVVYATNDDAANMAFSARLKYQNVEPINGPVYTYDPETFAF
ncbi:hypothetical protein NQ317_007244 [Molorchus minor]|uniref:Uncharacterized protein n=1 Tax=Molorchus minor TaxID=1323400 RepID=A0ABQ9JWL3_9CUCU|nr:hypothetical protein NQ317_007244 [Molorchus minor]